jgi:competence ComEA-like helix-hairpin-helix protein
MVHKLNNAQKRGLLIGLAALVLLAGWRLRARQLADAASATEVMTEGVAKPTNARVELNTADTTLLQTVKGIGPASARRIVKYRSLIGGFTHTDQLLKVWGITPENFIRIEEQVFVDTTTTTFAALKKGKFNAYAQQSYPSRPRRSYKDGFSSTKFETVAPQAAREPVNSPAAVEASQPSANGSAKSTFSRQLLDINTADSSALVEVSGIGPGTARNIVKYRSLIFYFDNLEQLAEVWGIRPENLERMKPYLSVGNSKQSMPHLKINEMGVDELGKHKYLGYKEAKILVAYREKHGPFADFAALQQVLGVAPEKLEKIKPYLVF